jgi:hypothetical protein
MDLLDSMKVYVCTVEKGSLSTAADACGMTPSPGRCRRDSASIRMRRWSSSQIRRSAG